MNGLPKRSKGRQSAAGAATYEADVKAFCASLIEINSRLDFKVSSRGWCYILEDTIGLPKGEFDAAQRLINACRKDGRLPLAICAEDESRLADHIEYIDDRDAQEEAAAIVESIGYAHETYTPVSFWEELDVYLEMAVEKIDLKSLFSSICERYHVPLTNVRGWGCLNSRAAMMGRFADWERKGKQCVLLFCGDHDPGGLAISDFLRSNMEELADAVGWSPTNLTVDRFGLNYDFIQAQRLSWIDNLETASGGRLDDPRHPDHRKSYVQSYLARFGARKVEANALVVRPEAGRELCRQAILRYVPDHAPDDYDRELEVARAAVRANVQHLLVEGEWR